jgi:hypothetical protein
MDVVTATGTINQARAAADRGETLAGTGFWKLVSEIKADESLHRHIDDVAEIDQIAFKNWAVLVVPLRLGTILMVAGSLVGLALVGLAYVVDGFWSGVWLLAGTGVLLVTTHGLAHLVVGHLLGIRFTGWFIGTVSRPNPGVKTDYSTYLRAPAVSRAWMHAAGAIVTKLIPFLMIGVGLAADAPAWSIWALVAIGLMEIATDVLWSTSSSDWKKFKREMSFVQPS